MAKNKNRDRKQQVRSAAGSGGEQDKGGSMEAQERMRAESPESSRNVSKKHQRRFGHN
ncbi:MULTISPECIES: hypothetical protein [Streptomyces]|uniref:hypothetical protein n=1 Tax=Streptomyces TaxID=1883 RepID=UPI001D1481FB|nr:MULTISPECIES: hypothetical protein [Streptomyces]MCC3654623.1 hypothetical protein [Streptomyces sp. S07_1.15]WSQ70980.1 hypothetical protein OG463_05700 [Streptomyces xinghaiensis]